MRPFLVRADRGYGNDAMMSALEERGQDYLLKLPMRKRAKELVAKLSTESGWSDVGQGWYGKSSELQLMGWSRKRRVVVMRRRRKSPDDVALPAQTAEGDQLLLGLSEVIDSHDRIWEYGVLVTSLEGECGEPHTCPTLSGSGRCRERIRRTEEPMGLGRVHNPGSQAHAGHRPNDGTRV